MHEDIRRIIDNFDIVDATLVGAAVVGGLGALCITIMKDLPFWAYQHSALFFGIGIGFFLFRNLVLRR